MGVLNPITSRACAADHGRVYALCPIIKGLLTTERRVHPDKGRVDFFRSRSPQFIQGGGAATLEERLEGVSSGNEISRPHSGETVSYPRSVGSTSNDLVSTCCARLAFPVCSFVKDSHPYVRFSSCHSMYSYLNAAYIYFSTVVTCSCILKLMQHFGGCQVSTFGGCVTIFEILLRLGVLCHGSFLFVERRSAVLSMLQKNITSLFFLPEVRSFPMLQRKRLCRLLSSVVLFSTTHEDC